MSNPVNNSIEPIPMKVFPTMGTLHEVVDYAESKLPIRTRNEMFSILMVYQNTLLKLLHERN